MLSKKQQQRQQTHARGSPRRLPYMHVPVSLPSSAKRGLLSIALGGGYNEWLTHRHTGRCGQQVDSSAARAVTPCATHVSGRSRDTCSRCVANCAVPLGVTRSSLPAVLPCSPPRGFRRLRRWQLGGRCSSAPRKASCVFTAQWPALDHGRSARRGSYYRGSKHCVN